MTDAQRLEISGNLAAIEELARKLRQSAGIPLVETCARWCETYSQMALWSIGERERFGLTEPTKE
jgi:hypothetical protein